MSELPSATVHPILGRLEREGWVISRWEQVDPRRVGRARRRYYQLTELGVERAESALERARLPSSLRNRLQESVSWPAPR